MGSEYSKELVKESAAHAEPPAPPPADSRLPDLPSVALPVASLVSNAAQSACEQGLGRVSVSLSGRALTAIPIDLSPAISKLNLSNNLLTSLEPITRLTNLKELLFSHNNISSLAPLSVLTSLTSIRGDHNPIESFEPLSILVNLTAIDCGDTNVPTLTPCSRLPSLRHLSCYKAKITDLTPLATVTSLHFLCCNENAVSSLAPLMSLPMTTLYFDNCPISTLTSIESLVGLREVACIGTNVSCLTPLRGLTNLTALHCRRTLVTSLEPLRSLTSLVKLAVDGSSVISLEPLSALLNLTELWCSKSHKGVQELKQCLPKLAIYAKHATLPIRQATITDVSAQVEEVSEYEGTLEWRVRKVAAAVPVDAVASALLAEAQRERDRDHRGMYCNNL